jgi:hypothetical protein
MCLYPRVMGEMVLMRQNSYWEKKQGDVIGLNEFESFMDCRGMYYGHDKNILVVRK